MSVLGKLQFWKKDEPISPSEQPANYDLGQAPYDPMQQPDPMAHQDPFAEQAPYAQQSYPQFSSSQAYPAQSAFPGRQPVQPMQQVQSVPEQYADHQESVHPRDVELILAKLDAIKSELDALHQRVRKIEQSTDTGQKRYW